MGAALGRESGQDQVSGVQGHKGTSGTPGFRPPSSPAPRCWRAQRSAVVDDADGQVCNIEGGDDPRPDRGEGVLALGADPQLVRLLQVPGRHIVADGEPQHGAARSVRGQAPGLPADDDGQFRFGVHMARVDASSMASPGPITLVAALWKAWAGGPGRPGRCCGPCPGRWPGRLGARNVKLPGAQCRPASSRRGQGWRRWPGIREGCVHHSPGGAGVAGEVGRTVGHKEVFRRTPRGKTGGRGQGGAGWSWDFLRRLRRPGARVRAGQYSSPGGSRRRGGSRGRPAGTPRPRCRRRRGCTRS